MFDVSPSRRAVLKQTGLAAVSLLSALGCGEAGKYFSVLD
jgi:hypothetical protein